MDPSRRSLVRAAAGVAWTAPLVATAVPAPALAASIAPVAMDQLTILDATYFWRLYPTRADLYAFVPLVTVRNDGPPVTDISVTLRFPSSFDGNMPDGRATMYFLGADWGTLVPEPASGDDPLVVSYVRRNTLPPVPTGATVSIGNRTSPALYHCLMFMRVATEPVTLTATAPGFAVTAGVFTQVEEDA